MATPAALGCRLHTVWAAMVAVKGEPEKFEVLLRRRVGLFAAGRSGPPLCLAGSIEADRGSGREVDPTGRSGLKTQSEVP